jgi:hypothetical protein
MGEDDTERLSCGSPQPSLVQRIRDRGKEAASAALGGREGDAGSLAHAPAKKTRALPAKRGVCSGYAPTETGLSPEMFDDFLSKPFTGEELVGRIRVLAG